MSVTQVPCPECGTAIPIKPGRKAQKVRCPGCHEKLDIDVRPGGEAANIDGPPAVGSGVTSFDGFEAGEFEARRRQRGAKGFGGGEIGGVGDLLFNPTGGQAAAMNALGSGGSMMISLILLVLLVAFEWFLPLFADWVRDPVGWTMADVIRGFPVGAHIGLAVLGLIPPFVLFGILLVPHVLLFRSCSAPQLFLSTMMVFVPFLFFFGIVTVGIYYEDAITEIAKALNEIFGDGIITENVGFNIKVSLWVIGLVVLYTLIHPVLLLYSTLRHVIGFGDRGAFFLTPLVIGLSAYLTHFLYWIAFDKMNLFGIADAFSDTF